MSGINLHLDEFCTKNNSSDNTTMWVEVANMINTKYAVDMAAKRVTCIVSSDRKICDALNTLRMAKSVIKTYGASESIMCVFNSGNTLSDVIGMEIPTITHNNAKSVGIACCENIDQTIIDAYEKVKSFFNQIVESANQYFTKLKVQASCQSATIDKLIGHVTNVDKLNAVDFSMDELFGYTQPVFMNRVNALQYISDNIGSIGASEEEIRSFAPYISILGYKITEKSTESLLEGDDPTTGTPTVVIEPETPEEQKSTAPDPDQVMNPQPVLPPGSDPSEVISTEDPESGSQEQPSAPAPIQTIPPVSEGTPDAQQTQTMAVFRWTPSTIVIAAEAVKHVLTSVPKFASICASLSAIRGDVVHAVDSIQSSENLDKSSQEAVISTGRSYASFVGDVIAVYNNSINELVDQIVSMAGKVVSAKSDNGVEAASITLENPFGSNAEYSNADPKPSAPSAPDTKQEEKPAEGGDKKEEQQPAEEPQKGEQKEQGNEPPAAAPEEGGETKNSVETPDGVPNDKPIDDPAKGVDPNGEPHPGKAPHVEPTETPEGEQSGKKAETLLGDIFGTRMW